MIDLRMNYLIFNQVLSHFDRDGCKHIFYGILKCIVDIYCNESKCGFEKKMNSDLVVLLH